MTRPEPGPAASDARVFHLAITAGDRSREMAINGPFETPELARLKIVLAAEDKSDVQAD